MSTQGSAGHWRAGVRLLSCAALAALLAVPSHAAVRKGKHGKAKQTWRTEAIKAQNGEIPQGPPSDLGLPARTPGRAFGLSHLPAKISTKDLMDLERRTPQGPKAPVAMPEVEPPNRRQLPQNPASPSVSSVGAGTGKTSTFSMRPAVMTTGAAQTIGTTFTGATLNGTNPTNAYPPDSMGAVGPTQFVVAVNNRMVTFDKNTGVADGVLNVTTNTFFSSIRAGLTTSDPRIRYDRLTGRWFVVMINVARPNRVLIAWSDDASGGVITASTLWSYAYFVNGGGSYCLADYPTLGIDVNALYIGVNLFCYEGYEGTEGYVLSKAQLLKGTGIATRFPLAQPYTAQGPYTPQGVDNFDPNATEGYFVGVDNVYYGLLQLRRVVNPGSTMPSISGNIPLTVPATAYPQDIPSAGASYWLDPIDDRLYAAQMRNGHLWTAQNIGVTASGVAASYYDPAARTGIRWYEINGVRSSDNGGVPAIVQSGTLYDSNPDAMLAHYYWLPSLMVTGQGHAAMGFSSAGKPFYADAAVAGRLAGDSAGTLRDVTPYTASSTAYNTYTSRWGDYSYTSVDPLDDMTMWTIQEFCDASNSYGVRVAKLIAPAPPTPLSVNPSTIPGGVASTIVTVTATPSAPKAFFDPGADLAPPALPFHHIGLQNDHGVVVNGATVVDANTVQFDLNTVGATAGTIDVTVVNPDGQSATAAQLLTIGSGGNPAPLITCPSDFSVSTEPTQSTCTRNVTFAGIHAATATGTPAPVITYSSTSVGVGSNTITATATSNAGSASCTFHVTLLDATPPVISCPTQAVTVITPYGQTTATVNLPVTASDACGNVNIVSTPANGSSFPLGTTSVTSVATDGGGNTASCKYDVNVIRGTALFLVPPCRLFDTRNATGPFGGPSLPGYGRRNVTAAGQCGIPADATAVVMNVTVVAPPAAGWLTLFPGPASVAVPSASTINFGTSTIANNATILLGSDGTMNVSNGAPSAVSVIIDVFGYFK